MPVTIVVTINARLNDLTELGINDSQYEKNKDCNDGDSYYPIRSHPTTELAMTSKLKLGEHYLRLIVLNVLTLLST